MFSDVSHLLFAPLFFSFIIIVFVINMLSICGSFAGVPAHIKVDGSRPLSLVSTLFVQNQNVPRTICVENGVAMWSTQGPVVVPTSLGTFSSFMPFKSEPLLDYDVILGMDWVSACRVDLSMNGP
jgi:hypothetical protein